MKISISMKLIWQFASEETIQAELSEVGPNQFFAALLKFAEIQDEEIPQISSDPNVIGQLACDIHAVRGFLEGHSIPPSAIRRQIRELSGGGNCRYAVRAPSCSQEAQAVLDLSDRIAHENGSAMVTPLHLLQALLSRPTLEIQKVINQVLRQTSSPAPERTALLEAFGKDLRKTTASRQISSASSQAKAIVLFLAAESKKGLLLLSNNEIDTYEALLDAARLLESPSCPLGLGNCELIDLTGFRQYYHGPNWLEPMEKMIKEAASSRRKLWLVLPSILPAWKDDRHEAWLSLLKTTLSERRVRCICQTSPAVYSESMKEKPEWRPLIHPMWLSQPEEGEIPPEL
ncbi:MAG TPA: hypothetical protein PKY88_07890 [Anaerohalosphaeraceae bacterium]|nr:hypothetical protein [Anaerohalosphaeraceae bacterium]